MPSCRSCSSALEPGQRYCLACGERAGAMPEHAAAMLGIPAAVPGGDVPAASAAPRTRATTLSAPAAAVAVMAILGFGVIVGSVVSPPAESAEAPAIIAVSPPAPAPPPAVTPPAAPASSAPAVPAPAPAVAQTVTQTIPAAAPVPPPPPPAPVVPSGPQLPAVKHVFMVVLPSQGYDATFGAASRTPYLSGTLVKQGELVGNYYAVTGGSLANEIALVSGQGPNPDTESGCADYNDFAAGPDSTDPQQKGQAIGTGCIYPRSTLTVGDELVAGGYTWKSYLQGATTADTTATPAPPPPHTACDHPVTTPFAYFHSVTDLPTCDQAIAGMDQLTTDLSTANTTPALSYIDGPADPAATDSFLKDLIPRITASPAYKDGGMIAITFTSAPQDGDDADSSACCAEPTYPNMPPPAPTDPSQPAQPLPPGADTTIGGGGHVGLLLISPFVKAGSTAVSTYNHYSLLRSIEDLFGLQPTGYAGYPGVLAFDNVIYNAPAKAPSAPARRAAPGSLFRRASRAPA